MEPWMQRSLLARQAGARSAYGWVGFVTVFSVIVIHLLLPFDAEGRWLFSSRPALECVGIVFLMFGPVLAVWMAIRHWIVTGRPFLSLVTLSIGGFLSLATLAAVLLGHVVG